MTNLNSKGIPEREFMDAFLISGENVGNFASLFNNKPLKIM